VKRPLHPVRDVVDLVRCGSWSIDPDRASNTLDAVCTALNADPIDAKDEIEKALANLTESRFCERFDDNEHPVSDVYALTLSGCGFYVKLRIHHTKTKENVVLISFHPPRRDMVTIGGDRVRARPS